MQADWLKLQVESARDLVSVGFDGYAVGGLSVNDMYTMLGCLAVPELRRQSPLFDGCGHAGDLVVSAGSIYSIVPVPPWPEPDGCSSLDVS